MTRVHGRPGDPEDVDDEQLPPAVGGQREEDAHRPGDVAGREGCERDRIAGKYIVKERNTYTDTNTTKLRYLSCNILICCNSPKNTVI